MREIKFRIWDERAKQYADTKKCVYIVGVLHNNKIVLGFDSPKSEYSLGLVLEQFTGLLDKNGKEIYEGDILKVINPNGEEDSVCIVKYDDEAGAYPYEPKYGFDNFDITSIGWSKQYDYNFEIIGNIHDNPELLKGETNV